MLSVAVPALPLAWSAVKTPRKCDCRRPTATGKSSSSRFSPQRQFVFSLSIARRIRNIPNNLHL